LRSSLSTTRGPTSPISTGRPYRDDRFSCSLPAPATSSRHLYTGHRQGHTQAAPWLREHPHRRSFVPGHEGPPVSVSSRSLSMRQQWFTHVRLLVAYLARSWRTVSATLTTPALNRRSLRWFEISACTATPKDLPSSQIEHVSYWRSSTSSSLHFQDTPRHTAPTDRPAGDATRCRWPKSRGCRRRTARSHYHALIGLHRSRLNFCIGHRTRYSSMRAAMAYNSER
jgi:hypothetical protein